jgi:aryl-alcohol dehydrogenase-like predicted oxidoreductase
MRKNSKSGPSVGDFVHIIFWDHAENYHDGMQFEVVGKLIQMTSKAYIIHTWYYHDPIQKAKDSNADENEHKFAIVKKAVDSIRTLK